MIKNILTTFVGLTITVAAGAQMTEEQRVDLTYKVVCLSDAELSVDAELLQIIGSNPDVVTMREDFQAFITSPKAAFESAIADYDALAVQEKTALEEALATTPQLAEALKKGADEYAKANKVSVEEATAILIDAYVANAVQQKTGIPNSETLVLSTAINSCGLANYIQTKITASGCKTITGTAVDMAASNQFCQSINADISSLDAKSAELSKIDAELKATIAKVAAALEAAANAQKDPISQSMDASIQKIVDAALNLVGTPAPVQIPTISSNAQ